MSPKLGCIKSEPVANLKFFGQRKRIDSIYYTNLCFRVRLSQVAISPTYEHAPKGWIMDFHTSTALERKDMYCNGKKWWNTLALYPLKLVRNLRNLELPGPSRGLEFCGENTLRLCGSPPRHSKIVFFFLHFLLNRTMFIMLAVCP